MASNIMVRLKADASQHNSEFGKAERIIGQYTNSATSLEGVVKNVMGTFAKYVSVTAAVTGAMKVAKDAFMATEEGIDSWGRACQSAQGAYDIFLQTINGGNWNNFFTNLNDAIGGARELYDALDRLGSIKSNNAAAIAIKEQALAQSRLQLQEAKNSKDQARISQLEKTIQQQTKDLTSLKNESVVAGKVAGKKVASEAISNSIRGNNTTGTVISDAAIDKAVSKIMTGGQKVFDSYANTLARLEKKGEVETIKTVGGGNSGSTQSATVKTFDLSKLTAEEQKQYLIAKAITDKETEIQKGISTFASAVNEGAANAKETFKYNRWSGTGSGSGSGGGNTSKTVETIIPTGSIAEAEKKVQDLQKALRNAGDEASRLNIAMKLENAKNNLDIISGKKMPTIDPFAGGGVEIPVKTADVDTSSLDVVKGIDTSVEIPVKTADVDTSSLDVVKGIDTSVEIPVKTADVDTSSLDVVKGIDTSVEIPMKTADVDTSSLDVVKGIDTSVDIPVKTMKVDTTSVVDMKEYVKELATAWKVAGDEASRASYAMKLDEEKNALKGMIGNNTPSMPTNTGGNIPSSSGAVNIPIVAEFDRDTFKASMEMSMSEIGTSAASALNQSFAEGLTTLGDTVNNALAGINATMDESINTERIKIFNTESKKTQAAWSSAAQAMSAAGSALNSIEDPGAKVAGILAEAVANIMAGYAAATVAASQTGNPWVWLGFAVTGLATAITAATQIKSVGKYAEGGVIGGNSYYGDKLYARVNSGETILNQRQAQTALDMMDSAGGGYGGGGNSYISGEDLVTVINNYGRRTGRGEILR